MNEVANLERSIAECAKAILAGHALRGRLACVVTLIDGKPHISWPIGTEEAAALMLYAAADAMADMAPPKVKHI